MPTSVQQLLLLKRNSIRGPGDISPGASFFCGLQPYNRVNLNRRAVVNLRRSSDSATQDFGFNFGLLNQAAIAAWGGVNATGTGSISGTTLTFTGGVIGGQVTGGTTLPGTIIISGSSPTWTVNQSQTVASAPLSVANALFVTKVYDQTGNGIDAAQGTAGLQPVLALNTLGGKSLPAIVFYLNTCSLPLTLGAQISGPYTINHVGLTITGGSAAILGDITSSRNPLTHTATAHQLRMGGAGNVTGVATDGAIYTGLFVYNGASSVMNISGTETTGTESFSVLGAALNYGNAFGGGGGLIEMSGGMGAWPSALDANARAAQIANMRAWWGI